MTSRGSEFGLKTILAIIVWFIGRRIIKAIVNFIDRRMVKSGKIDPTLARYLLSIINAALTVALIIGILDMFGVQTTSFAALLAGAGLAVGTAWGGLLAHFAAGVYMQILRPFKVGDFVSAAGVEGTVIELGLLGTTLISIDNVVHIIGNNKVFSETIKNYSVLPYRRVDCEARVAMGLDVSEAIKRIEVALASVRNVLAEPRAEVEISRFTVEGPQITVRAFANNNHYWQVYFDITRIVERELGRAIYPLVPVVPQVAAK
ncbi:MAG: mechanosensitive ion channel family protein [Casimicrobium sp.]